MIGVEAHVDVPFDPVERNGQIEEQLHEDDLHETVVDKLWQKLLDVVGNESFV